MTKIVVKSTNIEQSTTNKGNVLHHQMAAIDSGGDFALPFRVSVRPGQPYAPGVYDLAHTAFRLGRFGGLELDPYNITLVPTK